MFLSFFSAKSWHVRVHWNSVDPGDLFLSLFTASQIECFHSWCYIANSSCRYRIFMVSLCVREFFPNTLSPPSLHRFSRNFATRCGLSAIENVHLPLLRCRLKEIIWQKSRFAIFFRTAHQEFAISFCNAKKFTILFELLISTVMMLISLIVIVSVVDAIRTSDISCSKCCYC